MPAISIFFGIVVKMFYNEHEPVHFHAEYHGQRGKFDLSGRMVAGNRFQDCIAPDQAVGESP